MLLEEPFGGVGDRAVNHLHSLAGWRYAYPAYIAHIFQLVARFIVGPCKRSAAGRNSQIALCQPVNGLAILPRVLNMAGLLLRQCPIALQSRRQGKGEIKHVAQPAAA